MPRKIIIHNHIPAARDVNAFEHALPREQEERNRDAAYAATGIRRMTNDASSGYKGYMLEERGGRWTAWDPVTMEQVGAPQRSIEGARALVDKELKGFLNPRDAKDGPYEHMGAAELREHLKKARAEETAQLSRGARLPANDPITVRIQALKRAIQSAERAGLDARDGLVSPAYIKFDRGGGMIKMGNDSDREIEAAARQLGIWNGDPDRFPSHTIYNSGKQKIGGG